MAYDLTDLSTFIASLVRADHLLGRLDKRVRASPVGQAFIERQHFADATAALWLEGEFVNVEDLVLHDALIEVRTQTRELTRAQTLLTARRRIFAEPPNWALSRAGVAALTGREREGVRNGAISLCDTGPYMQAPAVGLEHSEAEIERAAEPDHTEEMAEIDAVLARAGRFLAGDAGTSRAADDQDRDRADRAAAMTQNGVGAWSGVRSPPIHDSDWDEEARLTDWLAIQNQTRGEGLPAVLQAAIAWDAWELVEPLHHQHWLGNLLVAALLRETGTVDSHLFALNIGLRMIAWERRKSSERTTRLLAFVEAMADAASIGIKELDRLAMAKEKMEQRLRTKRKNSSLPLLVELVLSRSVVSTALIAKELKVSRGAALSLVADLDLREVTGQERYRAWEII